MGLSEILQLLQHHHGEIKGDLIVGSYDISLVIISLVVPIVMSFMALNAANIAQIVATKKTKNLSIAVSSLAMGTGVWAMHFIGMLAFKLPAQVAYSAGITLVSILPSLLASWITMRLLTRARVNFIQLLVSGTLMGVGIGSMHFLGMLAIETELTMTHDPKQVILSVIIAIVLAVFALWINFGLRPYVQSTNVRFMVSSIVMGIAIASMHYMAMTAARFYGEASQFQELVSLNYKLVAYSLASLSIAVGLVVFALNNYYRSAQMYEQLDESKLRLRAIIDTVVDAIITIDSKGLIQEFSPAAESLFGYTLAEVYGKNVTMLMPEPYKSQHDEKIQEYLETGQARVIGIGKELSALHKDGSIIPIRISVGKIELPNDEMIFVGLITDISQQIKLASELRETAEKAELAATIKSNFLANMSHEIRTPMNAIIGFTELLMQSDLSDTQRNQLGIVHKSSNSLLRLINDILVSSKLDSGKVEIEEIDFSLKSLAMQLQSTFNLAANKRNIYLKVHYANDMPIYFKGDSLRLLQVMNNLVGNAIKFTEKGGVDIHFSYDKPNVIIMVKDTGIGMTPEQVDGIFKPFSQADASISRRFGGTGLGTTIAKQLVNAMDGYIGIESIFGEGSDFTVTLPMKLGEKPEETNDDLYIAINNSLNVLAVDDVHENLELLDIVLKDYGHKVTHAHDGQEAFDKYLKYKFDLILMDVHMPGIDGLQATQKIRQHERNNNLNPIPIVALSASVLDDDRMQALRSGMNGFAQKPINIQNLFNEVSKVIKENNDTINTSLDVDALNNKGVSLNNKNVLAINKDVSSDEATNELSINWDSAISLWGSHDVLVPKITGFLNEIGSKYVSLSADKDNLDRSSIKLDLHGLRGVAGNLGLDKLFNLASFIEESIDSYSDQDLLSDLNKIRQEVDAIADSLYGQYDAFNTKDNNVATSNPTEKLDIDDLREKISDLIKSLNAFEYDDELLTYVCDSLRMIGYYDEARNIRSSAEEFNFERACSVLEGLQV